MCERVHILEGVLRSLNISACTAESHSVPGVCCGQNFSGAPPLAFCWFRDLFVYYTSDRQTNSQVLYIRNSFALASSYRLLGRAGTLFVGFVHRHLDDIQETTFDAPSRAIMSASQ